MREVVLTATGEVLRTPSPRKDNFEQAECCSESRVRNFEVRWIWSRNEGSTQESLIVESSQDRSSEPQSISRGFSTVSSHVPRACRLSGERRLTSAKQQDFGGERAKSQDRHNRNRPQVTPFTSVEDVDSQRSLSRRHPNYSTVPDLKLQLEWHRQHAIKDPVSQESSASSIPTTMKSLKREEVLELLKSAINSRIRILRTACPTICCNACTNVFIHYNRV
jgi:hypothetical protein